MAELRRLRYFLAVAEDLSFVRAAERLHISQPPLSVQVKSLEQELGVQLFERTNRGVNLTVAGKAYYTEVRALLAQLEHATVVARRSATGHLGRLAIGFVSIADYTVLPQTLKLFRESYPDVELVLSEETSDVQIQNLKSERIDVGIALAPIEEPGLTFEPLLDDHLILALSADSPESRLKRPSLSRFRHSPFVSIPRPLAPGLYDAVQSFCARSGFAPNILQHARQMQTIISIVSTGLGVALIPSALTKLKREGVSYLEVKEQSPRIALGVVYRSKDTNPAVQNFIALAVRSSAAFVEL